MAKIGQLSPTFQPRNQQVSRGTIDVSGLARGIGRASDNYMAALQIRDNARLQRSAAQASAASWEMKNYTNAFLLNLDNPAKMIEAFGGGVLPEVIAGAGPDADFLDTTTGQTMHRNMINAVKLQIDDPDMQDEFFYQQMNLWEDIEIKYQAQVNMFLQREAGALELGNLGNVWEETAGGSNSEAFREKLSQIRVAGYLGADPLASLEAENAILLNYQKAEETALKNFQYQHILIPIALGESTEEQIRMAATGINFAEIAMEDSTYDLTEKEMNQVLNGAIGFVERGSVLTEEEDEKILNEWIDRAIMTKDLYNSEQATGRAAVEADSWQEVYVISENLQGVSPDQMVQAAENKIAELTAALGTSMGKNSSSAAWMPGIELGLYDPDDIRKQIDRLRMVVKNGGADVKSSWQGITAAQAILTQTPRAGEASKAAMLIELVNGGHISVRDYKGYVEKLSSLNSMDSYRDATTRFEAATSRGGILETLNVEERNALSSQLTNFLLSAGNLNTMDQNTGIQAIIDDWTADTEELSALMTASSQDKFRFYRTGSSGSEAYPLEVGRDFADLQEHIDQGNVKGLTTEYAPMLAEYSTEMSRRFVKLHNDKLLGDMDTSRFKLNDLGDPLVVASVVDISGKAMIAIALKEEYQEGRQAGSVRVAVVTPVVGRQSVGDMLFRAQPGKGVDALGFEAYPVGQDFMVAGTDSNGETAPWFDSKGDFRDGVIERRILGFLGNVSPATGQNVLYDLSVDPNAELSRQLGLYTGETVPGTRVYREEGGLVQ